MRKATADCPDAETLAALADDTLPAAARREIEGHIVDCDRCQTLTAAMVRAESFIGTPTDVAAAEVPAWRRRAFNWLVPAAAAATAVALWVLVPGQRTPPIDAPQEESQTVATSPSRSPEVPPSSEAIAEEPLRVPAEAPAANGERDASAGQRAAAEPATRSDMAQAGNAAALQDGQVGQTTQPAARQEGRLAGAAAPPAPPPATAPPVATAPRVATAPPPAAAPPPLAETARRAEAVASFDVISPTPQIRWRVGPGPVVQYSADGGASWTPQPIGMSVVFSAGSAPSPDVCWLVGRGGSVLRTTDGGRQWQRLPFPEMVDLTAITASTVRNATVVLADGRRFVTDDGGVMWIPVR